MKKELVFIIAGEKSGDKLGAEVMSSLKKKNPNLTFAGVGGSLMQASGIETLFDIEELSIMGFVEILPKLNRLLQLKNMLVNEVLSSNPICVITIDSPDFCFRVAKKIKKRNPSIKTIHYVAPSLWAWRSNRGYKIVKYIDHVLTLFPFEPQVLSKYGINSEFVGHPISLLKPISEDRIIDFRKKYGLTQKDLLLILLPGSRVSEVKRILPVFLESLELLNLPKLKIMLPVPNSVIKCVDLLIANSPLDIKLFSEDPENGSDFELKKSEIFSAADVAIAASGTVTLELAAYNTPMVVGYDVNWVSRQIISILLKINHISLVNIILDKKLVPEYVGGNFKANLIASELNRLVVDEALRNEQKRGFSELMQLLNNSGSQPPTKAGDIIYGLLKKWHLVS